MVGNTPTDKNPRQSTREARDDNPKVVDDAMISIYKRGDINPIYAKWFLRARPEFS
jgi:hypothetical protein